MPFDLTQLPGTDPTSIYRYRDGLYASDLLTVAVSHLDLFTWLADNPSDKAAICRKFDLRERPADVMLTLLSAMGLLRTEGEVFYLTEMAREHLVTSSPWCVGPYFASIKERPVCMDMVQVLRTGRATNWASLKDHAAWAKAMEHETFAKQFTAAMDCRGALLGPALAKNLDVPSHRHLLDIAGGSGVYSCAIIARHTHLRATVLERPPVDGIARKAIAERGFENRIDVAVADMFTDAFPADCDVHLFSNVLHDWDKNLVQQLLKKSFAALPTGGVIIIHDAHINAAKSGPLPVAAYSALLMTITEGKCYSEKEMADYLQEAGFSAVTHRPTVADRSVITARK